MLLSRALWVLCTRLLDVVVEVRPANEQQLSQSLLASGAARVGCSLRALAADMGRRAQHEPLTLPLTWAANVIPDPNTALVHSLLLLQGANNNDELGRETALVGHTYAWLPPPDVCGVLTRKKFIR